MNRKFKSSRRAEGGFKNYSRNKSGKSKGYNRRRGNSRKGNFQSESISHNKFVNKNPKALVEEVYVSDHTFADFGLSKQLIENLSNKGYLNPTRIQDESIPKILEGRDLVGLANTGSGKTAAFVLPIIEKLLANKKEKALIIAPTRELASQIENEFKQFAKGMGLYSVVCVGGLNIRLQIRELARNPQVIIGTPGRLKDLINQNKLKLGDTAVLVLDEADRMLDMGFLPDIRFITAKLSDAKQSLCFSATITPTISNLLAEILKNPVTVSVRTSKTGEHIAQDVIRARSQEDKMKELLVMLAQDHFEKVLIFGKMKHSVQRLAEALTKLGFPAEAIHGNKSQPQRQRALNAFRNGRVNILVATDVAARGLDIPNVSHVINFDQPNTHEEYVHRIGRTGRIGKPGQAYTFV